MKKIKKKLNNDIVENENEKIILFFQLIFRNEIKIEIKHISNIVENSNTFNVINITFQFNIFKINNYAIINEFIDKTKKLKEYEKFEN